MIKSSIIANVAVMIGVSTSPLVAQAASLSGSSVDVVELTSAQIQLDLAAQKYTVQDLVSAYQQRIDQYNPLYNAVTYLNPYALQDAAAADAVFLANNGQIPDGKLLFGVPIVIKDSMNIAGVRTTSGYTGFTSENSGADMIPLEDARSSRG